MERKIGEIFNYQDNLYQCIKSITCTNCGFNNKGWVIIHKEAIYDKETAEKIAKETTADVIRIQKIEWEE